MLISNPSPSFTDRELQVITCALQLLNRSLQDELNHTTPLPHKPYNQFDLLAPKHTLMHTLTALTKLTNQPPSHFQNPNPSQTPTP